MIIRREKQSNWGTKRSRRRSLLFLRIFSNTRIKEMAGKKGEQTLEERARQRGENVHIYNAHKEGRWPTF